MLMFMRNGCEHAEMGSMSVHEIASAVGPVVPVLLRCRAEASGADPIGKNDLLVVMPPDREASPESVASL